MAKEIWGVLFGGRYRLAKKVSGNLFKVYDREQGGPLAIKIPEGRTKAAMGYLMQEFELKSGVAHPHLVAYHDFYNTPVLPFFTMDWVKGPDILGAVGSGPGGAVRYGLLRQLIFQAAQGLHHLHNHGICHGDVKPAHILLNHAGQAVLIDFSLSRRYQGQQSGTVDGTFAYMAPEIFERKAMAPASDWYSLGVVLYECLTGRLPEMIWGLELHPPVSLVAKTPDDLNCLAMALLEQRPALRPPGRSVLAWLSDQAG